MFPFDLAGPPFLLFYLVFGMVVLTGYWHHVSRLGPPGPGPTLSQMTADPYQIAYLRGASEETVRLAIVNLIDRGFLLVSGDTLRVSGRANDEYLRRPLDLAILARCATITSPDALCQDSRVRAACADYERNLQERGLLYAEEERSRAMISAIVAFGLLGGVAVARIIQALLHGRHNILFLIFLAFLASLIAWRIGANNRTRRGRKSLSDLQVLMSRLKGRAKRLNSGSGTNEAVLFASVFGVAALPLAGFPFLNRLFPKARATGSGDSGGGSGGDGGGG
ncbi:MAG: TIGR04222 domain-containing membrane protein, partial [Methylococcaceae bacterium]|nr:TIGR04222 domain-containing membrane protein [Methylococcaceae bacterium]